MIKQINKKENRKRRSKKIISKSNLLRLSIFKSLKHIYAQIIDDSKGHTIVSYSTEAKGANFKNMTKVEAAKLVGKTLGQKALKSGIKEVACDRRGYIYKGRVKALADAVREAGVKI